MTLFSKDPFFDELKEWSQRKLLLLQKYLESATKILNRVYYVDGFAGRGTYGKPGQPLEPGSPLRAAQLAQQCAEEKRPYALRCINVEINADNFHDLQTATAPYGSLVTNICGAFAGNVDRILRITGVSPVICFLDPFGVDGIDWSAVKRLIHRNGKIDFWIRFDVDSVRRRFGHYGSDLPGADKQFDILCRVYGIDDRGLLYKLLDGPTAEVRKKRAVDLYLHKLREEFKAAKGDGYADAYRIESLEGEEKCYLVFATENSKGIVLASNIVYGIEEVYQKDLELYQASKTMQASFFEILNPSEDEVMQEKVDQLKEDIWQACTGQRLARRDIHATVLSKWFGRIKGPHITRALKQMGDFKDGRIIHKTGAISDDNTVFTFRTDS